MPRGLEIEMFKVPVGLVSQNDFESPGEFKGGRLHHLMSKCLTGTNSPGQNRPTIWILLMLEWLKVT